MIKKSIPAGLSEEAMGVNAEEATDGVDEEQYLIKSVEKAGKLLDLFYKLVL